MSFLKKLFFIFLFSLLYFPVFVKSENIEKGIKLYKNKEFKEALPLIEKEAKSGNAEAQFILAKMYDFGEGVNKMPQKALYWYEKSAEQGNPKAQNNLAYMYSNGEGVNKSIKKAFILYSLSANQGLSAAQFNLGLMYSKGKGIDQDYKKALFWYKKSAEQNYTKAFHALGVAYQNGEGVPANRDEAIRWYKKAAAQGYARSMANLGSLYYPEDAGDLESWDEAYKWYSMAIDHGDRKNAPLGLGLIHLFGSGRYPVDNAKAYSLFTLAAENGRADGWYWLGVMEEYGFGRPQDEERAMELYKKAANAGVEPAINRLEHGHQDWSLHLFKAIRPLFTPYY